MPSQPVPVPPPLRVSKKTKSHTTDYILDILV